MKRTLTAAVVLCALVAASVAWAADQTITATPPNRYSATDVTIDQGNKVTFTNNDTVSHDVTARDKGSDGKPVFASDLAGTGESKTVKGTEYLTTGTYDFVCSIHPQMTGTLHVTSAGTPAQRPASGGGSTPPPSGGGGGSSDTTAPTVTLKLLDAKLSAVRGRGALRVRVTTSEAATVKLTASAGRATIGSATASVGAAAKTVSLKLNAAGRRAVRRVKHLRIAVAARASDAAGNAGSAQLSKRL
jgi:plastocyanin